MTAYGRFIYSIHSDYKPTNITGGAPPCMLSNMGIPKSSALSEKNGDAMVMKLPAPAPDKKEPQRYVQQKPRNSSRIQGMHYPHDFYKFYNFMNTCDLQLFIFSRKAFSKTSPQQLGSDRHVGSQQGGDREVQADSWVCLMVF